MANLYVRIRPQTLGEIVGNAEVVKILAALFAAPAAEMPHAFLLHGPSGTGKTTLARIIAARLGCDSHDAVEINGADTRGIDTVRELSEQTQIAPLFGAARVIIMDEAAQLTKPAQSMLLKAVEDAPESAYWVFCTTDFSGVIPTIRNRCVLLETQLLSGGQIVELVKRESSKLLAEDCQLEPPVLAAMVEAAEGSPRRALVLLEQILDMPQKEAITVLSLAASGVEGASAAVIDLCRAVASASSGRFDWKKIGALLAALEDDPERVRAALCGYLRSCLLKATAANAGAWARKTEPFAERQFIGPSAKAALAVAVWRACSS